MINLQNLVQGLLDLGQKQKLILAVAAFFIGTALVLGAVSVNSADFLPLYKNLSATNSARIDTALTSAGFETLVSDDGGSVSVKRPDLARARMVLAESGLPIEGDSGWELFDEKSGWAMNSFLQRINRLRALEGELARSIQTLDGVQSARVHLVLPQREAFTRSRPDPRASVIVRAAPGRAVTRKQAIAVRNLVASSVAELELNRVTVLSANGETILAEDGSATGHSTLQSAKSAIEDRLAQEVENILSARVGAGNARVSINVDLNSTSETVIQQSFDPDQQVVRSTQTKLEERNGSDTAGRVGVENNIPSALTQPAEGRASKELTKSGEEVRYEIGSTRRESVRVAGEITRISAAVLINGIFTVDGNTVQYAERDPEEMERLKTLIKTAVGFNEVRGDSVSVDSFRFMDYSMELGQPVALGIGQQITNNIGSIIRGILTLAIVASVLLFGVKPALRFLTETQSIEGAKYDTAQALSVESPDGSAQTLGQSFSDGGAANGLSKPRVANQQNATQILDPHEDVGPNRFIEKVGVSGALLKHRVEAIQSIASEKPEEALRVLRSWLTAEV